MVDKQLILIQKPEDFKTIKFDFEPIPGLIGISEELNPELVKSAYKHGLFPWFNHNEPILWWSPDPRQVLFTNNYHASRSLKKIIKKNEFTFKVNTNFSMVIKNCQQIKRKNQTGTWIDNRIIETYSNLHKEGVAYSFEVYSQDYLVGGIYGLLIGKKFFGESMFHKLDNASKVCFFFMCQWLKENKIVMIDSQVESEHISNWGGELVSRRKFIDIIKE